MQPRSPWLVSLLNPLNFLMLVGAAIAGLLAAWWLFPIGVALWAVMVVSIAREPALQLNHQLEQREPLAQRFQAYYKRIERAQLSIFNSLASASPRMRQVLEPLRLEIGNVSAQAYDMCRKMTALENHVKVSESRSNMLADLKRINMMLENASDEYMKKEYQESKRALEERLEKMKGINKQLNRVEAQLLSLANDMESIVSQVIRLQTTKPAQAETYVPGLLQQLRRQAEGFTNGS